MKFAAIAVLLLAGCASNSTPFQSINLQPGITEIHKEWVIPENAHDVEVVGAGSVLRAASDFRGRAIFVVKSGTRIRFRDFTIDGNRGALEQHVGLPGSDAPFPRFTVNNRILIEDGADIKISNVNFRQVAGFAILVSGAKHVRIERVQIEDSGSPNAPDRHNTRWGILLEEGNRACQQL